MALLLALGLTACEKDKEKSASVTDGGSDDKQAAVDPSLAKAVAAASAKAGSEPGAALEGEGPPPNGVFPPGAADQAGGGRCGQGAAGAAGIDAAQARSCAFVRR
jgi:hypothetical protein